MGHAKPASPMPYSTKNRSKQVTMSFICFLALQPCRLMCHVFSSPIEIKREKFQEAINDCNHVLSVEPNNVKGTVFCIHSRLGM